MTSLLGVTFTWTGTPTGMAGISTNGPANVPFGCTPLVPYQYFTFAWSQFGNGCPYEYSYNAIATTCVYTADLYNSQTWGCTWTTSVVSTSTVNGGPTTAPAGVPATVTAPIQWVTITSTGSTVTSSKRSPWSTNFLFQMFNRMVFLPRHVFRGKYSCDIVLTPEFLLC